MSEDHTPSPIAFLGRYVFYFVGGILLLIASGSIVSHIIHPVLGLMHVNPDNLLWSLPYGFLLSAPLLFLGLHTTLKNFTTQYTFSKTEVRLLLGGWVRQERHFRIGEFHKAWHTQNIIEALFGIGTLHLLGAGGFQLIVPGLHEPRSIADALRHHLGPAPATPAVQSPGDPAPNVASGAVSPHVQNEHIHSPPESVAFAAITLVVYFFFPPIAFLLNIAGLLFGPRRGCFVTLLLFFIALPIALFLLLALLGAHSGIAIIDGILEAIRRAF